MLGARKILALGGNKFKDEYSLAFDGTNDYIDCGDTSDWNFSSGSISKLSLSLWFKHDTGSPGNSETLIAKYDTGADKREWRLSTDTDDTFGFWVSSDGSGSTVRSSNTSYVLADTNWHHIVVTYDGSVGTANLRCQIYVDGVDYVTTGGSNHADLNEDDAILAIAGFTNSGTISNEWGGNISEVAIYNSPLTANQVKTLYNGREPYNHKEGVASGNLKAWYRMGDGVLDDFNLIGDETNATLGSNLVTNGDFSTGDLTGWSTSGTVNASNYVEYSNGGARLVTDGTGTGINQGIMVAGVNYKLTFDVLDITGTAKFDTIVNITETGSFTEYFTASQTAFTFYRLSGAADVTIDNVSLKTVNGNAGIMTNMTADDFVGDTP